MNKNLRWFLVFAPLIVVLITACGLPTQANVTSPEGESSVEGSDEVSTATLPESPGYAGSPYQGTVKPPPPYITTCEPGEFPLGGVALIKASALPEGWCMAAELRPPFAIGRLPDGVGQFLGDAVNIRYFEGGDQQYELPPGDEDVQVCFAVLPDTEPQIYFYDFYGPRFGKSTGQPEWVPVETTLVDGMVCASAMTSGAYAVVGP